MHQGHAVARARQVKGQRHQREGHTLSLAGVNASLSHGLDGADLKEGHTLSPAGVTEATLPLARARTVTGQAYPDGKGQA